MRILQKRKKNGYYITEVVKLKFIVLLQLVCSFDFYGFFRGNELSPTFLSAKN